MVNFFRDTRKMPVPVSSLQAAMQTLIASFRRGPLFVQEEIIVTLSEWFRRIWLTEQPTSLRRLLGTSGHSTVCAFRSTASYRVVLIPATTRDLVFEVLTANTDKTHHKLVGRAMECATLVGLAVGKAVSLKQVVLDQ